MMLLLYSLSGDGVGQFVVRDNLGKSSGVRQLHSTTPQLTLNYLRG